MKALSRLEEKFAEGVVAGKPARTAAIEAGYAPTHAANRGSKLLKKPKIKAYIELRRASAVVVAQQATNITLTRLFEELGRVGLADIGQCFDGKGQLIPLHLMPEDIRRAVSSFEVDETFALVEKPTSAPNKAKKGQQSDPYEPQFALTRTTKVRFWDKLKAIESIAKLAGYLREESQVVGEVVLSWDDGPEG